MVGGAFNILEFITKINERERDRERERERERERDRDRHGPAGPASFI